ncbi:MAG: MFS transporter [Peptococcaceae bacterium BICA1-8]|nr:MAG: MFS transporter [Peptococcaceae bacterium BICA1-8]
MTQPDPAIRKYTQITISIAYFFVPFMASALNLSLPSIGREFGANIYLLSWVTTGYILAAAVLLIPFGRLSDIRGRKKIFFWGVTLLSFSALLCGFAWSLEALIFFRMLQGTGASMIFATGMAILTSAFPPQERGKVLGINAACVYFGQSMAPVLGGSLTHYLGWRSIFFLMFIAGLLIMYFVFFKLQAEWAEAWGEKYDTSGALLYSTGLVLFIYGLSSLSKWGGGKYLLVIGIMVLILFSRHEARVTHPILHVGLFTENITFAFSNLAALINYSATFATAFLLSMYLQVCRGYDAQIAGLILLAQPMIMATCSPFMGRLSDRIQPRIVASWGMALTSLGLILFSFLQGDTPIWILMINQAIIGVGISLFITPNNNAIMSSVSSRYYGVASSTIGTMRLTGQTISMALVTLVVTLIAGNIEINPVYADLLLTSTKVSFMAFAVICFGGIFASLARGNLKGRAGTLSESKL